jgi:diaminohydroxyphosphoribosylaminopyrimidine deaminase/5-amino-6-(5-phosphoribosylamino)uracil reductase
LAESTIYVTLEPCNHYGKTPPCADLIIKHQFKRVVIGSLDPFPLVNGGGINRLKEAGIEVVVGVLQAECDYVNRRFLTFHQKKRPYIILKWAETADGFMDIDRTDKERKINWITGEDSQKLVHQWRSDEQGILVGWKTILNDNPQLNVRLIDGKSPIRIVIDPYLNAPMESNIYNSNQKTLIYNKIKSDLINNLHYIQFETLTFATLLESLYEEQIISVLVEGGKNTLEHFLNNNTWDEIRRFRSVKHFEKGLKSPEINLKPDRTITIGNDKLDYYIFKQ